MQVDPQFVHRLIFGGERARRFTQDSPILPEVWRAFTQEPGKHHDLLLAPHIKASPGRIAGALREALGADRDDGAPAADVAYNQFNLACSVAFDELVQHVLPRTHWWQTRILPIKDDLLAEVPTGKRLEELDGKPSSKAAKKRAKETGEQVRDLAETFEQLYADPSEGRDAPIEVHGQKLAVLFWMATLIGTLLWAREQKRESRDTDGEPVRPSFEHIVRALARLHEMWDDAGELPVEERIWGVHRNRPASASIADSVRTVKADAGRLLFDVRCDGITWAVLDSGVDARHRAFRDEPEDGEDPNENEADELAWIGRTRVERTYDFTRIRHLLNPARLDPDDEDLPEPLRRALEDDRLKESLQDLKLHLNKGRQIDWTLLEPFLAVHHDDRYSPPRSSHGTHVAGILGARGYDRHPHGVCPDIRLLDLRVLDEEGNGDEFSVISALQFLRYLNSHKDYLAVHGANLSLSIRHEVRSFACGVTPVCEEAERLMSSGVVVVAAAGNLGHHRFETANGEVEGFLAISITDPGNAQKVLTVGATHRANPHTYGVSYFSSRGPTGDGRAKPDLVAPGEKIEAPVPGGDWDLKDGTSMAAPHVSGAAALLMARHGELEGKADRIKEILVSTATCLGRERYFQGSGLVDVLRALQSV